jgi:hypothetical protein
VFDISKETVPEKQLLQSYEVSNGCSLEQFLTAQKAAGLLLLKASNLINDVLTNLKKTLFISGKKESVFRADVFLVGAT